MDESAQLAPQLDVLRAPEHAPIILLEPPERKPAPFVTRLSARVLGDKGITFEDNLKNPFVEVIFCLLFRSH